MLNGLSHKTRHGMTRDRREKTIERLLFCAAATATLAVLLIMIFVVAGGLPALIRGGVTDFLLGSAWRPSSGSYGILALLCGSLAVTLLALLVGVPTGVAGAVFLAEMLPARAAAAFRFAIELLAGIPSVVYGFWGLVVLAPLIRSTLLPLWQLVSPGARTTGFSVLTGGLILAIMILPTIISLSENALAAVPHEYREASLALGASTRETVLRVLLPAARSGVLASVILGMGRAIGETMAVLLVTGNTAAIPHSVFDPVATLTGTIALEMSYADAPHQQALFAVGIVLFGVIFALNLTARAIAGKLRG